MEDMTIINIVHIRGRRGVDGVIEPAFTTANDGGGHCELSCVGEFAEAGEDVAGDVVGADDGEREVVNVRMTELWDDVEDDMDGGAVDEESGVVDDVGDAEEGGYDEGSESDEDVP